MARTVIFGCLGPELTPDEARFFRDCDPWGFILFARNVGDPAQLSRLTAALRDSVGRDAPVLVDQEGGRVARMGAPHWSVWENALAFVDAIDDASAQATAMRARYRSIGQELRAVGIDVNCAPMVDIATPATHPRIAERCYGRTARQVTRLGRAVADGLVQAGVLPVLKHVPGHGRTPLDSHKALPVVDVPLAELQETDFAPFRALADLPLAMIAHIVYPALDADAPASQSAPVARMLREEMGLTGLLMSDDINMDALAGSLADRAAGVLAAGYDVVLHCNGKMDEMQSVAAQCTMLSGDGLARANAALALRDRAGQGALQGIGAEEREVRHA